MCSVNSINIARVITQSSYYVFSYLQAVHKGQLALGEPLTFAVPTGAFGNCCGGYLARRMGLPIAKIIAATNMNDIVTRTLQSGDLSYGPNVATHR